MSEWYRYDLHVHTRRSADAHGTVMEIAQAARAAGLHGLAITDHNAVWRQGELQDAMDATGLLIVPGCEVSALEGHLLALGVESPVPRRQDLPRTVAAVEDQGGTVVPSHPLRVLSGVGPAVLRRHARSGLLHAAEGRNARERPLVQANTAVLLDALGLAATGGTDAHWVHDVGTAWTELDSRARHASSLVAAVRTGRCRAAGGSLPRLSVWRHGASLTVGRLRGRLHDRPAT